VVADSPRSRADLLAAVFGAETTFEDWQSGLTANTAVVVAPGGTWFPWGEMLAFVTGPAAGVAVTAAGVAVTAALDDCRWLAVHKLLINSDCAAHTSCCLLLSQYARFHFHIAVVAKAAVTAQTVAVAVAVAVVAVVDAAEAESVAKLTVESCFLGAYELLPAAAGDSLAGVSSQEPFRAGWTPMADAAAGPHCQTTTAAAVVGFDDS
jgi:hypothetical protein